jgi:hypothetical protein
VHPEALTPFNVYRNSGAGPGQPPYPGIDTPQRAVIGQEFQLNRPPIKSPWEKPVQPHKPLRPW